LRNLFHLVGLRHLKTKAVRTALTTFGISLGIALFVAIKIINHSTLSSFKTSVEALAGKTTLAVTAGEVGFPEEKLEVVARVPGVKHAVPLIQSRAYFAGKPGESQGSETIMVLGVDLLKEQGVRTYKMTDEEVIEDPLVFLNQPDSIILTHSFAREHGLAMDSVLNLATAHGVRKFTVRGLLSPSGPAKAFGGGIAIMDIDGARHTFGKEGKLDRIDIVTAPGADIEATAVALRSALGQGYFVQHPEGQSQGMQRMVESFHATLSFFSTFALLVGLFLIMNSVSMSVAERKKEIGTLRALGATRWSILRLIVSEAIVMGAVGSFFGGWIGRAMAGYLVGTVTQSLSDQVMTRVEVKEIVFGTADLVKAVGIGTFVSMMAAAIPALRAMKIAPLEAMKKHDASHGSRGRVFAYSAGAAAVMLAYYQVSSVSHWGALSPFLSTVEQLCAVMGPALIGPILVLWLIRGMRALDFGNMTFRLAQDNLLRNARRTGSNVMSLMVGFMLVTLLAVTNLSFTSTVTSWYDKVFSADMLVSSSGNVMSMDVQPLHESFGQELARIPGVDTSYRGGIYGIRATHINYEGRTIVFKAIDPADPAKKRFPFDMVDRPAEDAARELFESSPGAPTIMVSENFMFTFKKKTGDTLKLPTPMGALDFRIVGVNRDFGSFEGIFYVSRDLYKKIWKDPLVSAFAVYVAPGFDAATVRKSIDQKLGEKHSLIVITFAEMKTEVVRMIDRSFAYLKAMEFAALLVGLIGLLNTLLMSILERTRELGMLRALGMSRGMLSTMIFQESLIQGTLGAVAAVILGSWIAHLWVSYSLAHLLGWMVEFDFPWFSVLTTVGLGIGVAILAGILPARRASNLEITWALQYE
jgi:putative ABC transport system permease protein